MTERLTKTGLIFFGILTILFGVPYCIIKAVGALAALDGNQLAANAGVVLILAFGGWLVFLNIKEDISERRARRFRQSYDLRETRGGTVLITDNYNLLTAVYHQRTLNRQTDCRPTDGIQTDYSFQLPVNPSFQQLQPVLPLLNESQRILLQGGSGTGKTTLLRHLCDLRLQEGGRVIILDVHSQVGKWSSSCEIHGAGRDYDAVKQAFNMLLTEMNRRYQEYSAGTPERGFQRVTVLIDEFTSLSAFIGNLGDLLKPLLIEARKTAIDFVVSSQSRTAKNLSLKGNYDLLSSFDMQIELRNDAGRKRCFVDETEYQLPGAYLIENKPVHAGGFTGSEPVQRTGSEPVQRTTEPVGFIGGSGGFETGSVTGFSAGFQDDQNLFNAGLTDDQNRFNAGFIGGSGGSGGFETGSVTGFSAGFQDDQNRFNAGLTGGSGGSGGSEKPNAEERSIIDFYRRTGSKNKTISEVFGTKNRKNFDRVNEVLQKYGIQ